jgi:hypothetical protein
MDKLEKAIKKKQDAKKKKYSCRDSDPDSE